MFGGMMGHSMLSSQLGDPFNDDFFGGRMGGGRMSGMGGNQSMTMFRLVFNTS